MCEDFYKIKLLAFIFFVMINDVLLIAAAKKLEYF